MADITDDILSASDDDESQVVTAAEVLLKIESLWRTERLSPTLECHQSELVDCMLDQITQMNNNLRRCKKTDLRLAIHRMELERVRYVVASYLRCRLLKIERFTHYLLEKHGELDDPSLALLSPQELDYAKSYAQSIESHFNKLVLRHITHEKLAEFDAKKMSVVPNMNGYVFLKVLKDSPGVLISDQVGENADEEVDLVAGDQHLMMYSSIQELLKSGHVELI
ncbi:hypothetical protein HAZT_HAZT005067 [Hyalella azteca]|nr:hypothetical protein HAZT_HAZT005067 [Hyalella azteca]